MWAFIPDKILNNFGIHYIPNKYLAVAVPTWFVVSVVCLIMLYLANSMMTTHPRNSYFTMQDRHSALAHPRDIDSGPVVNRQTSPISNFKLKSSSNADTQGHFLNEPPKSATRSGAFMLPNYDPYRKIPDCVELPITVVNNVLYA